MVKTNNKKILTILLTMLLTITNFSIVFAEDEEIITNNEDTENINNEDTENENLNNNINQILINQNQILNNTNDLLLGQLSLTNNIKQGQFGKLNNFNLLEPDALNYYYLHYNDIILFSFNTGNTFLYVFYEYDSTEMHEEYLGITDDNAIRLNQDGSISYIGTTTRYFYWNHISDDDYGGLLKLKINSPFDYELRPFKLNIIDNDLGSITNSINIEPYVSTNIYYDQQQITLTYNNTEEKQIEWYLNGIKVSEENSYTFNISTDTTIELKEKTIEPITNKTNDDIYNVLMYILGILIIILFKSLIWGV